MAIQTQRAETRYSDFKINFDIHPTKKDLSLNLNEDAVKRSIKNILFTDRFEKLYKPDFGAGLKDYLFENIDEFTADTIKIRIIEAIRRFEPRARLESVTVKAFPDMNAYSAKIVYRTINSRLPVTLEVILNRVR